ncbi:MAG: twin-arginine translocase subunit TatC [Arenimonas sp.]|uniref:twin-arginine translocase subunit TatC n=1 Tax=Arenimonas sp. TaxID=1872635 RepID=UPI0025BC6CDE|nr:twin-arginine translocase subunit TatC [Arenimonas sp.]MBW8368859.1 twin-arginine translocase subunit TatC [Arenimonas sp.]
MSTHPGPAEESLMGHLLELRSRLLRSVIAVLVVFLALMPFASDLYARFSSPILAKLPTGSQLQAIDVAGGFFIPIKLAFFAALLVAMPYLIYQVWAFVAPGLYQSEKKLARPILGAAVTLFYVGCAFAWFLVLPMVFGFLAMFTPDTVAMIPDVARYLDFVLVILLAFGLSFELPVAEVILVVLGLVTPAQLREARGYVVVGVFILAAIITPPDVVSQLMLAIPLCVLYELGIIAGALLQPKPAAA